MTLGHPCIIHREAYGIDGVALQSFGPTGGLAGRVLNHSLAAAAATDRVLYVEYDLSGAGSNATAIVAWLEKDWALLVAQGVTAHPRYAHQDGLPVVGVFGWYMNRFSAETGAAIVDAFKGRAWLHGAGQWEWRVSNPTPAWQAVFYNLSSWSPWNSGNWNGVPSAPAASVGWWGADAAAFKAKGVPWLPDIYPGISSWHRDRTNSSLRLPRLKGGFLWAQFVAAARLGIKGVFARSRCPLYVLLAPDFPAQVGMFDELDEGTQILKVVDDPPAAGDLTYEGLPSDVYLCWVGLGTAMLRGDRPLNATVPDCAARTKPTTPRPLPGRGDGVLRWAAAAALRGGGAVAHYEVRVGGVVRRTPDAATTAVAYAGPEASWRVRAVNTLGNAGGWSLPRAL